MKRTRPPIVVEPTPIADTFVTGMLDPEFHANFVRVTLYADRHMVIGDADELIGCPTERVIIFRGVMTMDAFDKMLAISAASRRVLQFPAPDLTPRRENHN